MLNNPSNALKYIIVEREIVITGVKCKSSCLMLIRLNKNNMLYSPPLLLPLHNLKRTDCYISIYIQFIFVNKEFQ